MPLILHIVEERPMRAAWREDRIIAWPTEHTNKKEET